MPMARDYKRENAQRDMLKRTEWERDKYVRLQANIDRADGEAFKVALKSDGLTFQGWLKVRISEYMGAG